MAFTMQMCEMLSFRVCGCVCEGMGIDLDRSIRCDVALVFTADLLARIIHCSFVAFPIQSNYVSLHNNLIISLFNKNKSPKFFHLFDKY